MKKSDIVKSLAEIMNQYNKRQKEWIKKHGNVEGFDEWFTKQVAAI